MPEYVEVVRSFRDADKEPVPADVRRALRSLSSRESVTWRELLEDGSKTPIVLVAPSQSGKTTEFERRAHYLRNSGLHAVYCHAGAIADGIEGGLAAPERKAYLAWTDTVEPLVLFIDAIDELYLRHRGVHDLVRTLERELPLKGRLIRLVLSARTGTWTDDEARPLHGMLERNEYPLPRVVGFEPLDMTAVRKLASACTVADVDAFMTAIDHEGLDAILDLRPLDVAVLAKQWNSAKRFGRWSHVMAEFVDASFTEDDVSRGRHRQLTVRDGWAGVMRVAAACTLMRLPHVSLPTVSEVDGAISSRRLFEDWPSPKLGEFFEGPLFIHKGTNAEAVQLPQGALLHFLTGRWIAERVKCGLKPEEVRDALMVQLNWETGYRIPAPHRAAIGWIAACNPGFRRLLQREYPEIVLFEGDPDELSDSEIRVCLDALCVTLADGGNDRYPSRVVSRKLARPGIEDDVLWLLRAHARSEEVQTCLLALAAHGRYSSCVPSALERALDRTQSSYVRAGAIDVVGAAGDQDQKRALVALTADGDDPVRTALLRAIVPEVLHGPELVSFIAAGGDFYFRYELRTRAAGRLDDVDLEAALRALHPVVALESEGKCNVGIAVALLIERLGRGGVIAPYVLEMLAEVERLAEPGNVQFGEEERGAIRQHLEDDAVARRGLWSVRLEAVDRDPAAFHHLHDQMFGRIEPADFAWLWTIAQSNSNARFVLDTAWARLGAKGREEARASGPSELLRVLDRAAIQEAEAEKKRAEQDARREEKQLEQLSKDQAEVDARRAAIESGDDLGALIWAWDHVLHEGKAEKDMDPVRLLRFVGPERVEVFRRGFIACWRKQDVQLPEPGPKTILTRYFAGLMGLGLEVRAGLRLSTLSKSEVQLATRYALYEHGLPFWFPDLLRAHPEDVLEVLHPAIDAEWTFEGEHHGLLSAAAHNPANVSAVIRRKAVELVRERPPASSRTLHWAVDLFLTESIDQTLLAEVAQHHVARGAPPDETVEWVRLWAHVDPITAARWMLGVKGAGAVSNETFFRIVGSLEKDLEGRAGRKVATAFYSPHALAAWVEVLLPFVPIDDDQQRGLHLIGPRDRARDFRRRCLGALAANPTPAARALLLRLCEEPRLRAYQLELTDLVERQCRAAATAMAALWNERDVLAVERRDEKPPRSVSELSRLVRRHLAHVHDLVANDDFSYRALFREGTREREIQLWVASCLRERAHGLYRIVRENVVDDDKEVDISVFAPAIGSVPIEIKPLGEYSFDQLEKVIEDQLLGRYMLPPDREEGVLLLVRLKNKTWRIDRRPADFEALVANLRARADIIGRNAGKVIHIERIDLLEPPSAGPLKARGQLAPGRKGGGVKQSSNNSVRRANTAQKSKHKRGRR